MYNNIGGKIKILAKVLFCVGAAVSLIVAVFYIFEGLTEDISTLVWAGVFTLCLGPLSAWLSTWLLYGFGVLVESNEKLSNAVEEELIPAIEALSLKISYNQTSSKPQNQNFSEIEEDNESFAGGFVVDTTD